jgi:hypothetical protein
LNAWVRLKSDHRRCPVYSGVAGDHSGGQQIRQHDRIEAARAAAAENTPAYSIRM